MHVSYKVQITDYWYTGNGWLCARARTHTHTHAQRESVTWNEMFLAIIQFIIFQWRYEGGGGLALAYPLKFVVGKKCLVTPTLQRNKIN